MKYYKYINLLKIQNMNNNLLEIVYNHKQIYISNSYFAHTIILPCYLNVNVTALYLKLQLWYTFLEILVLANRVYGFSLTQNAEVNDLNNLLWSQSAYFRLRTCVAFAWGILYVYASNVISTRKFLKYVFILITIYIAFIVI